MLTFLECYYLVLNFSHQDTVNILVDLVSGKATEKGKKKLKKVLRRPVICICNDLYAPALRTLRQCAIVLQFPSLAVSA